MTVPRETISLATMDLPIYFISDIHLMLKKSNSEIERQNILFQFLHHVGDTGGTLVINGDLFDFYFEYKDVIPKVFVPFYHEMLKTHQIELSGILIPSTYQRKQ